MYTDQIKALEDRFNQLTNQINETNTQEIDIERAKVYEQLLKLKRAQADYIEDDEDDYGD